MNRVSARTAARTGLGALRYRLSGHRMPLAATLVLTHRCNALCRSCALPLRYRAELDTRAWVKIIDELAAAGTVRVGFTGGEALVREDLGVLVDRCAEHGLWTTLETNGYLYPARAEALRRLDRVMIGWEGRAPAHDVIREPGAWRQAERAVEVAAERGVGRSLVMTLTSANLEETPYALDRAERAGADAVFQLLQPGTPNAPAAALGLVPDGEHLRRAIRGLIEARAAGRPVAMSEKLLRYILAWPDLREATSTAPREDMHCVAGQLHCAIDPDGTLLPCTLMSGRFVGLSAREVGLTAAFDELRDISCRACTSTPLTEYNFLFNLNPPALYERAREFLSPRRPPA